MTRNKLMIAGGKVASALALTLAATLLCCASTAFAQSIGSASAIKNEVQGIRGTATRTLAAGGAVYNDDEVKTGADSLAQLLFVDQSTFSIAANSEAALKNVFHGKQPVAQRVISAVAGAFRYVSGVQTSNTQINFPYGYLTVRGTIVDLVIWPGRNVIILVEGKITVVPYATGVAYDMDRPGTFLVVYQDGHVDGPMTWNTEIIKVTDRVPFPLYGTILWPNQETFEQWDDRMFLLGFAQSQSSGSSTSCPQGQIPSSGGCFTPEPGLSDVRLKRDIVPLEHLSNGLDLYRFRYLWSDTVYVGVMAQEVEKLYPDAVVQGSDGYLRVRYDRLGLKFMTWDEWSQSFKH